MSDNQEQDWVRLIFVDVFGASHAVVLPTAHYDAAVAHGVPFDGSAIEGRARHLEADMLLLPEPSTLRTDGPAGARVCCTVTDRARRPWLGDPRTALVAMIETFELASVYQAAAELEYYLLDEDGAPVDRGGYFGGLNGPGLAVTQMAAERLADNGIDVIGAHLEAGPGQYELDLAALSPLALADALVLAKEILHTEAAGFGLRATFMARPFTSEPGSGLHLQQRLDGTLFDERGGLSPEGRSFIAGQLTHAVGLTALAAPNVNSYKRLHSGAEAPSQVVWGHSNRAALVRVGSSVDRRPAVEFRLADPSANPYLLVGGLLAAAGHGLDEGLDPGQPFDEDLGGFDPATAESMQLRPLPRDLDEALDALLADDVLVDAFDSRLLSRLVDGRRAEAEEYRSQVSPWEINRYLDEA